MYQEGGREMAGKIRDYSKLAKDISELVGGKENIVSASRCATRLRLVLRDTDPDLKEKVASLTGVITVVENNGQFQIVIGQHVGSVHEELLNIVDLDETEEDSSNQGTILNRVIATMSAVFAPFIYILAAAGILQGALIVINLFSDHFENTGTYEVLSFMSWAPFTFLPIFIAITAAKHFKVNTYLAVLCAAALVSPEWTDMATRIADGETITFLGVVLSETTYTSSVLPPLFLVWLLSYVEKFFSKRINEIVKPLFLPLICFVIMVPLTILVIGPLTTLGANGVANGYNYLADHIPLLAGAIIGGLWQILVIFGVHWGVTPMVLANFEQYGRDSFQAYQTIAVVSQIGAVLGVIIKARSQEVRNIGVSAGITGIFGITEPSIYGITLRFKKPFIYGCISGAIGAIVASFFKPYYFAYAGLPGPLTIVNAIDSEFPTSIWGLLIGVAIALVLPIILIYFFGFGEDTTKTVTDVQSETTPSSGETVSQDTVEVSAPLTGTLLPLEQLDDPVFSSGAMGSGIAINPADNKVYAPFDGVVTMIAPTKHAIGITSNDGIEMLIHIGIDTVKLDGSAFNLMIAEGDEITINQVLMEFDVEMIQQNNLPTTTPVIITNASTFKDVQIESGTEVTHMTKLFTVSK